MFSDKVLFWVHDDSGALSSITYGELGRRINQARGGLAQLDPYEDE